jgi:hypothetical protein
MTWNVATHVATSYSSQIPHHSANDEVPKIYCNTRRATVKHHHDQLLDNCSISELMSCQAHVKKFTQSIHNMCSSACTFGSSMASPTATSCFFPSSSSCFSSSSSAATPRAASSVVFALLWIPIQC